MTTCRYTTPDTNVGECGCPPCDADDCVECIAHVRPGTDGKRYCERHFLFGTSTTDEPLQGILSFVPKPGMAEPRTFREDLDAILTGRVRL